MFALHKHNFLIFFFLGGGDRGMGFGFKHFWALNSHLHMFVAVWKIWIEQKSIPGFCFKNMSGLWCNILTPTEMNLFLDYFQICSWQEFYSFSRFNKGDNSIFFKLQSENSSYFPCQYDEHVHIVKTLNCINFR